MYRQKRGALVLGLCPVLFLDLELFLPALMYFLDLRPVCLSLVSIFLLPLLASSLWMCFIKISLFLNTFSFTFKYRLWYMQLSVFLYSLHLLSSQLWLLMQVTSQAFGSALCILVPVIPAFIAGQGVYSALSVGMVSECFLNDQSIFFFF